MEERLCKLGNQEDIDIRKEQIKECIKCYKADEHIDCPVKIVLDKFKIEI